MKANSRLQYYGKNNTKWICRLSLNSNITLPKPSPLGSWQRLGREICADMLLAEVEEVYHLAFNDSCAVDGELPKEHACI